MKKFTLEQLTEGIRGRNLSEANSRLVEKWSRTGLLRGLENTNRENMARLLENQAAELLREQSSVGTGSGAGNASGDIRGFTNIAFPIVRRVFGGLIANELVSVQPMSLPSGLLFYLDYTYGDNVGGNYFDGNQAGDGQSVSVYSQGSSIYNNPAGSAVRSGSLATGGMYDLAGSGFSRVHSGSGQTAVTNIFSGSWNGATFVQNKTVSSLAEFTGSSGRLVEFDSQISKDLDNNALDFYYVIMPTSNLTTVLANADLTQIDQIALYATVGGGDPSGATLPTAWGEQYQDGSGVLNLRRHNRRGDYSGTRSGVPNGSSDTAGTWTDDPLNGDDLLFVLRTTNGGNMVSIQDTTKLGFSAVVQDGYNVSSSGRTEGSTLVIPSFESNFSTSSPSPVIPEIDIKVESVAVTAQTRKLRARWSPELAQDLNAYHSLDAEVELTQILSEQVALEIDREILNDLLTQANGANLYWSRSPGKFVNKLNGNEIAQTNSLSPGPAFTGTVREWYETLIETVIDVANQIHRKTLRGSANFIVVGPDVATILESSVYYRPALSIDGSGQVSAPFQLGAEKVGSLSNRFTVYKDPYFPRNRILVGFKGGSYLETGYVYAPYVPLIVTPTIFQPEDFTPRKGVMTRYGKKMVRSDFYGTVTCMDMNVI